MTTRSVKIELRTSTCGVSHRLKHRKVYKVQIRGKNKCLKHVKVFSPKLFEPFKSYNELSFLSMNQLRLKQMKHVSAGRNLSEIVMITSDRT
jgi:hypothetical protein